MKPSRAQARCFAWLPRVIGTVTGLLLATGLAACGSPDDYSYEEVTVDLTVYGERGTFSALTQCRKETQWLAIDGPGTRWLQTGGAVVGEFPSGRGFVLVLGDICAAHRLLKQIHPYQAEDPGLWRSTGDVMPSDPQERPYKFGGLGESRWELLVFNDTKDPKEVEYFLGPDYFMQGGGDVAVHTITTRRSSKVDKSDWMASWDAGGGDLGWLARLNAEHDGEIEFTGIWLQPRTAEKPTRGNAWLWNAVASAVTQARATDSWVEVVIQIGLVLEGEPSHPRIGVRQSSGALEMDRRIVPTYWRTWIYARPSAMRSRCSPFDPNADLASGLRLIAEGSDTGLKFWQRDIPNKEGRPITTSGYLYERSSATLFVPVSSIKLLCFRPARFVEERAR